jgi:hypothetical protein
MNTNDLQKKKGRILLIIGGIAGILASVLFRKNWSAEFSTIFRHIPGLEFIPAEIPINAIDWFELINNHPFIGLVYLNFFDIVNYLLVAILLFTIFSIMPKNNKKYALFALIVGISSIILYLFINNSFIIINLTNQYVSATSDSSRLEIILEAERILQRYNPGLHKQGYLVYTSQVGFALSGEIYAILVFKNFNLKKWIKICGIISHGSLLMYLILFLFIPDFAFIFIPLASPFLLIWYFCVGMYFIRKAKYKDKNKDNLTE